MMILRDFPGRCAIYSASNTAFLSCQQTSLLTSCSCSCSCPQLMRGEGNWATLGMFASLEGRILSACDALLGCAPFWFRVRRSLLFPATVCPRTACVLECVSIQRALVAADTTHDFHSWQGQRWLQRHAMSLERIAAARTAGEMADAVAAIEEALAEAGVLTSAWLAGWRAPWRASLAAAPDMRAMLLHVAALQVRCAQYHVATLSGYDTEVHSALYQNTKSIIVIIH